MIIFQSILRLFFGVILLNNYLTIKRVPRFRRSEWGACFYDCIATIDSFYKKEYESLAINNLNFSIVKNNLASVYTTGYNDPLFHNMEVYQGMSWHESKSFNDFLSISVSEYVILAVKAYEWGFDPHYKDGTRVGSIHYSLVRQNSKGVFAVTDPYYNRHFLATQEEIRDAYKSHYYLEEKDIMEKLNPNLASTTRIVQRNIHSAVNAIDQLLSGFSHLEGFTADNFRELALFFADNMELQMSLIRRYTINVVTNSIMDEYIRNILKWQLLRKVTLKNIDTLSDEEIEETKVSVFNTLKDTAVILENIELIISR